MHFHIAGGCKWSLFPTQNFVEETALMTSDFCRWSLPEIKDCLEEAGFRSVHFWLRQMPDTEENKTTKGFGAGQDIKYEEVKSFEQQDSWNAYIVAVA